MDYMDTKQQFDFIKHNTAEIVPENELLDKLKLNNPLRVKLGIDPTAPNIHLGNAVVLRKLREFQDLGHTAILIVGDFTAKIGDPSGRSITRPQMTDEEIKTNVQNYKSQIFKILNPDKAEFRYNSEWLARISSEDIIKVASKFTVAQLLEREELSNRYKKNEPISLHELLYAIFQGYDSVAIKADIELGATEQKFNLLVGRELQRMHNQEPQIAIMMPILVGLDGVKKMSKSYNNYIGITETPKDMFGKIMSIPDTVIKEYFTLAAGLPDKEIKEIEKRLKDKSTNPRDIKLELAQKVVSMYYSEKEGLKEKESFLSTFSKKEIPSDIPVFTPEANKIWIVKLLSDAKAVPTRNEARRLIEQGAVEIDGATVKDINLELELKTPVVLKIGKRQFLKVIPK